MSTVKPRSDELLDTWTAATARPIPAFAPKPRRSRSTRIALVAFAILALATATLGALAVGVVSLAIPEVWTRWIWPGWLWAIPVAAMAACVYFTLPWFRL